MDKKHKSSGSRYFIGFIFLAIGGLMIMERAGLIGWELYDFFMSWKMLLVAIGAFIFIKGSHAAGVIVMAVGTFFMLPDIFPNYHEIKRYFWPGIILVVGLIIMFSPRRKKLEKNLFINMDIETGTKQDFTKRSSATSDFFDETVVFGGREVIVVTKNLLGGRSTSIFGGNEIDLRQCEISPQGCNIEITTLFGSSELKVPNDWTIVNKMTTIFGGFSDLRIKDPSFAPNTEKMIVISGVCIFGGTEIRNYGKSF